MEMTPTQQILETLRAMQSKALSPEQAREQMAQIKREAGEQAYQRAHRSAFVALARG